MDISLYFRPFLSYSRYAPHLSSPIFVKQSLYPAADKLIHFVILVASFPRRFRPATIDLLLDRCDGRIRRVWRPGLCW